MWGNLVPLLLVRIFNPLNKGRAQKIKVMLKNIIKLVLALGLLFALSSCGSTKNGIVLGKGISCKNGVCSSY